MALLAIGTGALCFPTAAACSSSSVGGRHFSRLSFSRNETLSSSLSMAAAAPFATSPPSDALPSPSSFVYCGRGDKKTAKGKRFRHSFGNARPRNKKSGRGPPRAPMTPSPTKKDKFDDGEVVKIVIDESFS